MKLVQKGFTLIELLVVVLIIGILAAIALPQYQKAVLKSRFASLVPLAKALRDGNEAYYLTHGKYTNDASKLDVTTTNTTSAVTLSQEESHNYARVTRGDIKNRITMYQKHSPNFAGEIHCEALIDNTLANWLCKDSLKGTLVGTKYGYNIYSLSENTLGDLARTYVNQNQIVLEGDTCYATNSSTCQRIQASNEALCDGKMYDSCLGGTFDNGSVCKGTGYMACGGNKYTNGSSCIGNSYWNPCSTNNAFGPSTFTTNSFCVGESRVACNGSTFRDHSYCEGKVNSCQNAHFREYSVCYAYKTQACAGSDYDATSYCTGNFCPTGSPSSTTGKIWYRGTGDEWPDSRVSELVDSPTED